MSPRPPTNQTSWRDILIASIFILVLALPLAAKLLRPAEADGTQENRRLAAFPELEWQGESLTSFPAAFEKFYDDRFGLRDRLIRWHHLIKLKGLGVSPSPKVILGKDGWMFDRDTVQYYEAPPLTSGELESWCRFLDERQRFVTAKGYPFLLVFAPVSSTVYPEYLPDPIRHEPRPSRLDQLLGYLHDHSTIRSLDLRETLLAAKNAGQLYQRTDTHWNELGAYQGYTRIMTTLARRFPELEPIPRTAFEVREHVKPGGDIARMLGLGDLITERRFDFKTRGVPTAGITEWYPEDSSIPMGFSMRTDDATKPCAIVYHDSFTYESLYPFLANNFSEVWFHWNHYYGPDLGVTLYSSKRQADFTWRPESQPGFGDPNRPVVVIFEIAERTLLYTPPPTWEQLMKNRRARDRQNP